jgi:hypothetical protein
VTAALVRTTRVFAALAASLAGLAPAAAGQGARELPRTHAPQPTEAAITPADLMTRLYVLADDSMTGREAGTAGNAKATDYVAAEFRRLGLEPAGENGTYFQAVPIVKRALAPGARLAVDGAALALGTDFVPVPSYESLFPFGHDVAGRAIPVVYGGRVGGQMLDPAQAAGKLVVFSAPLEGGRPSGRFWIGGSVARYSAAAGVAIASLEVTSPRLLEFISEPITSLREEGPPPPVRAGGMLLSTAAAQRLLGAPLESLRPGAAGRTVLADIHFVQRVTPAPARNVVAILRGSDPALRNEYVAVGAHNDHLGILPAVEHDSLRAFNAVMRREGANTEADEPTPAQWARIRATLDSLRRLRPARVDSIANGADDDGSGTVVMLEIAQELASRAVRPRRSILFVSHTGEELGLLGSQHFTDHPTVPRDSIVTQLNMDMVGRGRAQDVKGGGPHSIQMIGSRRLATELGDTIDALNARRAVKMDVDYSFDAPGHPYNRYCRSDHYMYARYGIPITYFSAGYHPDYHQVSDEPQYIDYDHMALIGGFVRDVALAVADMSHRPVVDHPKPDPHGGCKQ